MKPSIKRFEKFIEEIIKDGQWEYGNGKPMTNDAKAFLEEWRKLKNGQATVKNQS